MALFCCLADTIGAIENIMIEIGDKTLLEIFVRCEKNGYRPFLMPKSAKKGHFSLYSVSDTL